MFQIFNWANFCLLILIIFCILNSFWLADDLQKQQKQMEVLVLEQSKNTFGGYSWYVLVDNNLWKMEDGKNFYTTGQKYLIQAEILPFESDNSFEQYSRFLGINGKIKVSKLMAEKSYCDFFCRLWKSLINIRKNLELKYINSSCNDFQIITKNIAGNSSCEDVAGLSVGLTIGGMEYFSPETKSSFKLLGLTHLVAVSGFQVVLLMSAVENIFSKLNFSRRKILALFAVIFAIFLVLVGPEPPILRSGLQVFISSLVLITIGRKLETWRSLAYSAVLMLLFNPLYLYSISFQLSFLASLGLSFLPNFTISNKIWQELYQAFISSLSSFLWTLPIIINLAGFISPVSLITNTLIVPIIPIITILNIFSLIPFLGDILAIFTIFLQSILIFIINDLGSFLKPVEFQKFSNLEIFFYYIILIILIFIFHKIITKTNKTQI
jgi:ComEC/Rec2-related protein